MRCTYFCGHCATGTQQRWIQLVCLDAFRIKNDRRIRGIGNAVHKSCLQTKSPVKRDVPTRFHAGSPDAGRGPTARLTEPIYSTMVAFGFGGLTNEPEARAATCGDCTGRKSRCGTSVRRDRYDMMVPVSRAVEHQASIARHP